MRTGMEMSMNTTLFRSGLVALLAIGAFTLSGCGGGDSGDTGPQGPQGPAGPPGSGVVFNVGSNGTAPSATAAAAWAALTPQVTVTSVSIASPPVVNFRVTDANGVPVVGLGNTSKSSTATVGGLTNLSFGLAKLVPAANGSPSRWVNYLVTTVPSTTTAKDANGNFIIYAQRPGTDNTGTLVDNGDGSYRYTFYRDVPGIKAAVAAAPPNPDTTNYDASQDKSHLDDLTYEAGLVHRLTIQVSGSAPGTGTNTPTGAQVAGAPAVAMVNPKDVIYDFVPATGQKVTDSGREIVATAKCEECHRRLGGIPGDSPESSGAGFHGGARNNTQYCVVCHTEQRKFGRKEATFDAVNYTFVKPASTTGCGNNTVTCTYVLNGRAVGNMPNHIHKTHMGEFLGRKGYEYGGLQYNEVKFPQDIRNCTKCHDGSTTSTAKTAQGNNWMSNPSRLACGACHDGIDFATGKGVTLADRAKGLTVSDLGGTGLAHLLGPATDDSLCVNCHNPGKVRDIDIAHIPVTPPNMGSFLHVANGSGNNNANAAWIASNTSRLPAGAIAVTYDIKSVSRNASKQPVMVFRMLQNGARADLNVHDSTAPDPVTGAREIWPNFMGAPSVYFVWSVPQDGLPALADFNASTSAYLRCLWNGTAQVADPTECISGGTLTGPDANGYYTATLTGAIVPDAAAMLTGGLGYSYGLRATLPLTQTNLADFPTSASPVPVGATIATATSTQLIPGMPNRTGGLIVVSPNKQVVAGAGCTAAAAPAGACTSQGGYTGRRAIVEDARCNKCHQELGTFTEDAFHGGQRNDGTTCSWCHTPNRTSSGWSADSTSYIHAIHAGAKRSVAFNWHASSATETFADIKFPGVLKECETCHLPGSYYFYQQNNTPLPADVMARRPYRTVATGTFSSSSASKFTFSPYVTLDLNYGTGFSFNAGSAATTEAAPTTLVNSPIATQCFACHDTTQARAHMEANGASIYLARSTALGRTETCMVCHDSGRIADIKVMHAK